jgi:phosphotransferase system HPr (HPr) family protein
VRMLEIEVRDPSGLHARPAALFVKAAASFASEVRIENLTRVTAPADAKSIIAVLTLGVSMGHRVRVTATGSDENRAIDELDRLLGDEGQGQGP